MRPCRDKYWSRKVGEVVTIPGSSEYSILASFLVVDAEHRRVWLEQTKPPFTQVCLTTDIGVGNTLHSAKVAIDRIEKLEELLSIPDAARHASKMLLRGKQAQRLRAEREEDTEAFARFSASAPVQASLDGYMAALKRRK